MNNVNEQFPHTNEQFPHTSVYVVDEVMGTGKSSAIINYINSCNDDVKFLVITPFLDEVQRYKTACPSRHFREPSVAVKGSKLKSIKELIKGGYNIVSTHALFQKFDQEIIEYCRVLDYVLVMDEVTDVVEQYPITGYDLKIIMEKYCDYNKDTGQLIWKEEEQSYEGKFSDIKNMCNLGSLMIARDKMLLWLFPIEVFNAFSEVYILTYMFNAQIQRYYYDFYGLKYNYMTVEGDSLSTYHLLNGKRRDEKPGIKSLVNIIDHYKLNLIGRDKHALSKSWYVSNSHTAIIEKLKNNVGNFFRNIVKSHSEDALWTTFKDYKTQLGGKGYTKGFIPINARATNIYRDRKYLAYLVNIYFNPMIKGFFQDHGVEVDEDGYALSEMLQWIWRSAIRDGNPIWLYVPSSRMRNLLISWIDSVDSTGVSTAKSNGDSTAESTGESVVYN